MAVYLITGGAGSIGANIAARLHSEGNSILFADSERVTIAGIRSVFCDFSDAGQVASLLLGVEAVEGKLDGLLHHSAPDDAAAHATAARLFHAAAPLLNAGAGSAVAIGAAAAPAMAHALTKRLGAGITVNWLAAPAPDEASMAQLAARATDLLVASA